MHVSLCYDALQNPTNRPLTNPFVSSPRAEFMAKDRRPGTFRIDHSDVSDSSELGADADHVPTEAMPAVGLGVDLPVTQLLLDWRQGDAQALEQLAPVVYNELRRLARGFMRGERAGHVLQTTALVHEAYLRLARHRAAPFVNRQQFFAFASRVIRHLLVDHIRGRLRGKRGGGVDLHLEDIAEVAPPRDGGLDAETLLAIDQVLARLESTDPRQARIVELRFFAGLTHPEIAEVLDLSVATVERHWRVGKRRLARQLQAGETRAHEG